jgi:hypothetical protein
MWASHRPWRYLAASVVGAVVAVALAAAPSIAPSLVTPGPSPEAGAALDRALLLVALLFLPASIFPAVVGAMFPSYSAATPVVVVRHTPLHAILPLFAAAIGYAVAASAAAIWWPITWLVAFPLVVLVGLGAIAAVWLLGYTLALLDPIRLTDIIAERGLGTNDGRRANAAAGDLCRLLRGMKEQQRLEVCLHILGNIETMWRHHSGSLEDGLCLNVLDEIEAQWGKRRRVREAVASCRAVIEANRMIEPERSSA